MSNAYFLVSPCRNEAAYLRESIDSILAQSVLPAKWVIVDDGSTDETAVILAGYSESYEWIEIVTRDNRGNRAVGPGVIEAFYAGFESVNLHDYEFFCKLDLDLLLPNRYFELLIKRMGENPRIGTCSGKSYIEHKGKLVSEKKGDETSLGMTKFYRLTCFDDIGGFVREVMWDGIDCHRCRMLGWMACSWDEPELQFIHLRPMGSSQHSIYTGRMRHGYGQYFMGTGMLFMLASSLYRMTERPFIIGGLAIFWGWLKSWLKQEIRYEDPDFRKFLRKFQMRSLFVGKKRATSEIDKWNREHIELKQ